MREALYKGPKFPPPALEIDWMAQAKLALTLEDQKQAWFAGAPSNPVTLGPDFVDYGARAVRRLFAHFKLDPQQPMHWRWLVNLFAYAEFWEGPKRKAGAPKRADDDLAAALASLPGHSNAEAARKLARKFAKGTSTSGLRRRIAKVRAKPKAGN